MPLDELIVKSDEKWIKFRIQLTLGILIIYSIICLILTVAEHESLKTFIGYFLIISPIFPIGLWRWWNEGRTIIIDKKGCLIKFLFYKNYFLWNELNVRQMRPKIGLWEYEGVVFSAHAYDRPGDSSNCDYYMLKHPFTCFVVNFSGKHRPIMYGQALPVVIDGEICSIDKERFINKMEEWNVKLETVRKVNEKDFLDKKGRLMTKKTGREWSFRAACVWLTIIMVLIYMVFVGKSVGVYIALSPVIVFLLGVYIGITRIKSYRLRMDEKGCVQKFLFLSKHYSWKKLRVKLVKSNESHCGEGVLFIKKTEKGKKHNDETYEYSKVHPFSSFSINFEIPGKKFGEKDALHEISKELFLKKMEDWGVDVEGL